MRIELEEANRRAEFVAINVASAADYQAELINRCSFPLFQDEAGLDAVRKMGAAEYDFLFYGRDGNLARYMAGYTATDLGSPDVYAAVKDAILSLE